MKNIAKTVPIPEQIEYEELTKKLRIITAKLRIFQEGVDLSSISQQKLDMIIRTFEDMDQVQRDTQQKTSMIQQNANIDIQKANQEAGKKFSDVQKRYQDLIKSLKEKDMKDVNLQEQTQIEEHIDVIQTEQPKEEIREKTHEETVSKITDMVLKAIRDSVRVKVDEILAMAETAIEHVESQSLDTNR